MSTSRRQSTAGDEFSRRRRRPLPPCTVLFGADHLCRFRILLRPEAGLSELGIGWRMLRAELSLHAFHLPSIVQDVHTEHLRRHFAELHAVDARGHVRE